MEKAMIYIHGKGGDAKEAEHYSGLFTGYDVIGFNYRADNPWDARREFTAYFDSLAEKYQSIIITANSIGAYFTMNSLYDRAVERALFISPVVDMERLIMNMMGWANVSEQELQAQGSIDTQFGERLSWEYLCYVRKNPLKWSIPTDILYGGGDNLTARDTIEAFAKGTGATLTVMESGEHWFHTEEQMGFLDEWVRGVMGKNSVK